MLLPDVMLLKACGFWYRIGLMNPALWPSFWLIRAIRPAHRGGTALVPQMVMDWPSTWIVWPVAGSASPATSGTPRPTGPAGLTAGGTPAFSWYEGRPKIRLT